MTQDFTEKTIFYGKWYLWLAVFLLVYALVRVIGDEDSSSSDQQSVVTSGPNGSRGSEATASRRKRLGVEEQQIVHTLKLVLVNDLSNLAAVASQYRLRASTMGGGQGSFSGFTLPRRLKSNENASFDAQVHSSNLVRLTAVSTKYRSNMVVVDVDEYGNLSNWTYTGYFGE